MKTIEELIDETYFRDSVKRATVAFLMREYAKEVIDYIANNAQRHFNVEREDYRDAFEDLKDNLI